jgi:hypothetical protein
MQSRSAENSESIAKEQDTNMKIQNEVQESISEHKMRKLVNYQIFDQLAVKNKKHEVMHLRKELDDESENLLFNSLEREEISGEELIYKARPIGEMLTMNANSLPYRVKADNAQSFEKITGEGSELQFFDRHRGTSQSKEKILETFKVSCKASEKFSFCIKVICG